MSDNPLSQNIRFRYFILGIVLFVVGTPILILYSIGFRFGDTWKTLVGTGGIYLDAQESNVTLYVNGEESRSSGFFNQGIFVQNLRPGDYTIEARKEGYETWQKNIEVTGYRVTEASAVLLPRAITIEAVGSIGRVLIGTSSTQSLDDARSFIEDLFDTKKPVASTTAALLAYKQSGPVRLVYATSTGQIIAVARGKIGNAPQFFCTKEAVAQRALLKTYIQDEIDAHQTVRTISLATSTGVDSRAESGTTSAALATEYASQGCSEFIEVYQAHDGEKIKYFDFYPYRNDVVLVHTTDALHLIELDPRLPRLVRTLYKGTGDVRVDGGTVYLKKGSILYRFLGL